MKVPVLYAVAIFLTSLFCSYSHTKPKTENKREIKIIVIEEGDKQNADTVIWRDEIEKFLSELEIEIDSILKDALEFNDEQFQKHHEYLERLNKNKQKWLEKLKGLDFNIDSLKDSTHLKILKRFFEENRTPKYFYFHDQTKPYENIIDLNDPSIIHFERKSISKNREKITIIIKKQPLKK